MPNHPQTFFTFCRICESRLYLPEEWSAGLCTYHAAGSPRPVYVSDPDWQSILEWIDAYTADPPPTGVIPRPNRSA